MTEQLPRAFTLVAGDVQRMGQPISWDKVAYMASSTRLARSTYRVSALRDLGGDAAAGRWRRVATAARRRAGGGAKHYCCCVGQARGPQERPHCSSGAGLQHSGRGSRPLGSGGSATPEGFKPGDVYHGRARRAAQGPSGVGHGRSGWYVHRSDPSRRPLRRASSHGVREGDGVRPWRQRPAGGLAAIRQRFCCSRCAGTLGRGGAR